MPAQRTGQTHWSSDSTFSRYDARHRRYFKPGHFRDGAKNRRCGHFGSGGGIGAHQLCRADGRRAQQSFGRVRAKFTVYGLQPSRISKPSREPVLNNIEHLIRLANRIGTFFEAFPDHAEGVEGVTNHIQKFWEPRMRIAMLNFLETQPDGQLGETGLSDIADRKSTRLNSSH